MLLEVGKSWRGWWKHNDGFQLIVYKPKLVSMLCQSHSVAQYYIHVIPHMSMWVQSTCRHKTVENINIDWPLRETSPGSQRQNQALRRQSSLSPRPAKYNSSVDCFMHQFMHSIVWQQKSFQWQYDWLYGFLTAHQHSLLYSTKKLYIF